MKNTLIYSFSWMILSALLASCSNEAEEQPANVHSRLTLYANIIPANNGTTRAGTDITGKSYNTFSSGDKIGLYSKDGNLNGGGFNNISLSCGKIEGNHSVFIADNLNIDYNRFSPAAAYYPYDEEMETANYAGTEIRDNDGYVEDFLLIFSNSLTVGSGYLSGGFEHAGARVIITLGEGFDKVTDQEITLTMNQPFKYFKVVDGDRPDGTYYKVPTYVPDPKGDQTLCDFKTYPVVENGATKYYAILPSCSNHIAQKDENGGFVLDDDGSIKSALSITAGVVSVTLKDNDGITRTISTKDLNVSELWRGNNYRLTIEMVNLVPTIYPHSIEPWGETTITTEKDGINNLDDLQLWMQAYNQNRSPSNTVLESYGSFNGSEENGQWSFYLSGDIDCSSISNVAVFLDDFQDKLDGRGYTLSNITLTSGTDGGAGFVKRLSGDAVIENLNIEKITVNDTGGKSIGTIASVISGGTIKNCTVEGLNIVGSNYAGALAGEMSSGSVTGCTFIGTVAGRRNDNTTKLVGNMTGGTIEGNNAANVIYNDIQ